MRAGNKSNCVPRVHVTSLESHAYQALLKRASWTTNLDVSVRLQLPAAHLPSLLEKHIENTGHNCNHPVSLSRGFHAAPWGVRHI